MVTKIDYFKLLKWLICFCLLSFSVITFKQAQDNGYVPTSAKVSESYKTYGKAMQDRLPPIHMHFGYNYTYQGVEYFSNRVTHGYKNKSRGVAHYPIGSKLTIYVNPSNPEYTVITKGVPIVFYVMFISGLLMLANLIFELGIIRLDKNKLKRPNWLQNSFNLTAPLAGITFLITAVMLLK